MRGRRGTRGQAEAGRPGCDGRSMAQAGACPAALGGCRAALGNHGGRGRGGQGGGPPKQDDSVCQAVAWQVPSKEPCWHMPAWQTIWPHLII